MKIRGNRFLHWVDRWIGIPVVVILSWFKGRARPLDGRTPKKILMLKLNALGDTMMILTLVQVLRQHWQDVHITYVGSNINQEILDSRNDLDQVMILDMERMVRSPWYFLRFIFQLCRDRYDVVIDGSQWERISAIMIGFVKSNFKIGFKTPGQGKHYVYHATVPHRRDRHELYCFHDLLQPLGITVSKDVTPTLAVTDSDREKLDVLLDGQVPEGAPIMILHPGCGDHGDFRQWSLEKYRDLGRRWLEANDQGWIVLSGVGKEVEICQRLLRELPNRTVSLAGKLDIAMSSALLERASILVCGNTGIMHMASVFHTPTVAIHGPTDHWKWGPINSNAVVLRSPLKCAPCLYLGYEYQCDCPECMDAISVEEVWEALVQVAGAPVSNL